MSEHRYSEPNRVEHQDRELKLAHHYWQHVSLDGTVSPRVYVGPPNAPTAATSQPITAQDGHSGTRTPPNGPSANGGDE